MFTHSWMCGAPEQQAKLQKLLSLWEAKNTYFTQEVIKKMKTPEASWAEYQADVLQTSEEITAPVKLSTKTTYESYRAQHQIFVNHALSQIQSLENQKMQLEQQQQQEAQNQMQMLQNIQPPPPPVISGDDRGVAFDTPPPNVLPLCQPPPTLFSHLPPELVPDFSKPPPGFAPPEPLVDDLVPSVPYYELPAGLMVPLILTEDFNYKALDPKKLRLPPAIPPSERLMQAVEAFYQKSYSGNTRERLILDADGWEKLGLYEYYKAKNAARKRKEMEIESGMREKSRSPSPIRREKSRSRSPKKKRIYKSRSPSPIQKSKSKSRSRSPPPPPSRHHHRSSNGRKSPRRASRNTKRSRSKSRSKSPSPQPARARSPTPPSFLGEAYGKTMEEKLDESNKGHQMLKKMGWSGAGLGSKEQGIAAPISGGEVRDRADQYKGVGVSLHDPYENFRKNKGKAFITRMKARAEERTGT